MARNSDNKQKAASVCEQVSAQHIENLVAKNNYQPRVGKLMIHSGLGGNIVHFVKPFICTFICL